jgi:hypothetical protein
LPRISRRRGQDNKLGVGNKLELINLAREYNLQPEGGLVGEQEKWLALK